MPRIEPGGPGLAVSPDHAWLAVAHAGKLRLIDTGTRETVAEVEPSFSGETDLCLSQQHLFAFVRMEDSTACLVYTLPALAPVTSMELMGAARPMAMVQERILVAGMDGQQPRILGLGGRVLTIDSIGLPEPVLFAAEAPDDRLLVSARDQLECWDPMRRRALSRLHLPIARPKLGGFSSRRRQLWLVSASASGPLEVFRFSDGRVLARAELGKRVVAVDGHPESPRLVVAAREDGQPVELVQFDLALGERNTVAVEGVPASFCVVDGSHPVLIVARADGAVEFVGLPRATPLEEAEPRPAKRAADPASSEPERPLGWRNRLANEKPGESKPASEERTAMEAARARLANQTRRPAEPKPAPRGSSAVIAPRAPRPPEPVRAPVSVAPAAVMGGSWRDALCAWATAALDNPAHAAPPPSGDSTPLARAVSRLELSYGASRGLALLYGQWLLGDGERGISLVALAQLMSIEDDPLEEGAGWLEALGRDTLGAGRLVRIRGGRARLRRFASRFLDGHGPRVRIVWPPEGATPTTLAGSQRVPSRGGELSPDDAVLLAQKLGRALAVVPPGPRAQVEPALAEARLHDAVPLVLGADESDSWAELTGEQLVLVADDEGAPALLRQLPLLE
jgi:hypothetical protein